MLDLGLVDDKVSLRLELFAIYRGRVLDGKILSFIPPVELDARLGQLFVFEFIHAPPFESGRAAFDDEALDSAAGNGPLTVRGLLFFGQDHGPQFHFFPDGHEARYALLRDPASLARLGDVLPCAVDFVLDLEDKRLPDPPIGGFYRSSLRYFALVLVHFPSRAADVVTAHRHCLQRPHLARKAGMMQVDRIAVMLHFRTSVDRASLFPFPTNLDVEHGQVDFDHLLGLAVHLKTQAGGTHEIGQAFAH